MQIYRYPFYVKLIYRYGNIFASLLLILYLIPLVIEIDENLFLIIPIAVSMLLLYFINKKYLTLYKVMPFIIEADDEKIICSDFIFSDKQITIYFKNIDSVSGGIFEGKLRGIMKVCDGKNQICIAFSERIRNSKNLIAGILSKVDKDVYDSVIERLGKLKSTRSK